MRFVSACVLGIALLLPLAEAQITTAPPSTSAPPAPPSTGAPASGRSNSGVGISVDLNTIGALFSGTAKGPCERFTTVAADERKKLAKNDCKEAESAVEQAKAELEKVKAKIGEERARRDQLRASARQAAARYQERKRSSPPPKPPSRARSRRSTTRRARSIPICAPTGAMVRAGSQPAVARE